MRRALAATLLSLALAPAALAQAPAPGPRASDVASLDAIMGALYDVISGPAGQARDWDRMRHLFVPGARLIPAIYRPDSTPTLRQLSVDDYITTSGPWLEKNGFFEIEVARQVERYGGLVHAFSTYESKRKADDATPFMRGINSIQLFDDGTRWWIVTVAWEGERPSNPIPPKYLSSTR
jgi:hypothetical protein